jgi:hypothetical protein
MAINLPMETRLVGVRVSGCGLRKIGNHFFDEAHHIFNICPLPIILLNTMKNHAPPPPWVLI